MRRSTILPLGRRSRTTVTRQRSGAARYTRRSRTRTDSPYRARRSSYRGRPSPIRTSIFCATTMRPSLDICEGAADALEDNAAKPANARASAVRRICMQMFSNGCCAYNAGMTLQFRSGQGAHACAIRNVCKPVAFNFPSAARCDRNFCITPTMRIPACLNSWRAWRCCDGRGGWSAAAERRPNDEERRFISSVAPW